MVEIARAVHHHARVLIFDEPTAALTPEEKFHFFNLVRRLQQGGMSIIFISHALEEALALSDRITVLRDGEVVATDITGNFDRERLVQAMVGRSLSGELYGSDRRPQDPPLRRGNPERAQSLDGRPRSQHLVLDLRRAGHGRLRPRGRRANRDDEDRRWRAEARLLPRRRSALQGAPGALPDAKARGRRRHRLCHRGPQGRGLLREHVDRREYPARQADQGRESARGRHHGAGAQRSAAEWTKRSACARSIPAPG